MSAGNSAKKIPKLLFLSALIFLIGFTIVELHLSNDSPKNIANWQEYKNTRYNYTIKYPRSWKAGFEMDMENGIKNSKFQMAGPDDKDLYILREGFFNCCVVSIYISDTDPTSVVDGSFNKSATNTHIETINNIKMTVYKSLLETREDTHYLFTDPSGQNYFRITLMRNHNSDFEPLKYNWQNKTPTMEKILSSFQFTTPRDGNFE